MLRSGKAIRNGLASCFAAGKKLLADPDRLVRLRTAQGLLGAKDKEAIPVLIELLEKLHWTEEAWQAEEMLHYIAGDESPEATIGAGSLETRHKCRMAWQEWWQVNSAKIDLAKLDQERLHCASDTHTRRIRKRRGIYLYPSCQRK